MVELCFYIFLIPVPPIIIALRIIFYIVFIRFNCSDILRTGFKRCVLLCRSDPGPPILHIISSIQLIHIPKSLPLYLLQQTPQRIQFLLQFLPPLSDELRFITKQRIYIACSPMQQGMILRKQILVYHHSQKFVRIQLDYIFLLILAVIDRKLIKNIAQ